MRDRTVPEMSPPPSQQDRRRILRLALRLGGVMIASGAQAQETETSLRRVLEAFDTPGVVVAVTYTSVLIAG